MCKPRLLITLCLPFSLVCVRRHQSRLGVLDRSAQTVVVQEFGASVPGIGVRCNDERGGVFDSTESRAVGPCQQPPPIEHPEQLLRDGSGMPLSFPDEEENNRHGFDGHIAWVSASGSLQFDLRCYKDDDGTHPTSSGEGTCRVARHERCLPGHVPDMCQPGTSCMIFRVNDTYLTHSVYRMQGFCADLGEDDPPFIKHFQHNGSSWPEAVVRKMHPSRRVQGVAQACHGVRVLSVLRQRRTVGSCRQPQPSVVSERLFENRSGTLKPLILREEAGANNIGAKYRFSRISVRGMMEHDIRCYTDKGVHPSANVKGKCWVPHGKRCLIDHEPDMCRPGTSCTQFLVRDYYNKIIVTRKQGFCVKPGEESQESFITHFEKGWSDIVRNKMPIDWNPDVQASASAQK